MRAGRPGGSSPPWSPATTFTCGLRTDGTVTCWGNERGPESAPAGVFAALSAGGWQSCGLRPDGVIGCWGSAGAEVHPFDGTFSAVSAGPGIWCGLRTDSTVACLGKLDPPDNGIPWE